MLAVCTISAAFAEEIGWQEAVARLAYERTKAETCVKELKKYGDEAAKSRGEDAYNDAKAEYDAICHRLDRSSGEEGRACEPARPRSSACSGASTHARRSAKAFSRSSRQPPGNDRRSRTSAAAQWVQ